MQSESTARKGTVYPKKYAHGFVVLCFVVVMQSFIMNSHEVVIHIHQGSFAGTGAIVRLPQCQWSKPDGYGKISQYITITKHSKAKTVCIFLGIYCMHCEFSPNRIHVIKTKHVCISFTVWSINIYFILMALCLVSIPLHFTWHVAACTTTQGTNKQNHSADGLHKPNAHRIEIG